MLIETPRLALREWRETDVDCYLTLSRDVGYNCFSPPGRFLVKDEDEARERIRERMEPFERRRIGNFPMFLKDGGEFVGTCGLTPVEVDGASEVELGYRLCLKHWGSGYAEEAARGVLRYGFDEIAMEKIIAFVLPQNRASVRILEKLGFEYQREFSHAGIPHRLYQMVRSQQPGVKANVRLV
jgi:[ribosomal protein S5]-alanine N-acetyltransferase